MISHFRAAAEHGRAAGGFAKLAALPNELGDKLTSLFRPQAGTKALHNVLLAGVSPASPQKKVLKVLKALICAQPGFFALGLALPYLLALPGLLVVGGLPQGAAGFGQLAIAVALVLPVGLLTGLLAAVTGQAITGFRALEKNYYGLCIGSAGSSAPEITDPQHLTDWLAHTLDRLACLSPGAGPLTFRHLWEPAAERIDLEVMTTNITFGRPARFPFSEAASNLKGL